jgi:hypothetical protein
LTWGERCPRPTKKNARRSGRERSIDKPTGDLWALGSLTGRHGRRWEITLITVVVVAADRVLIALIMLVVAAWLARRAVCGSAVAHS